MRHFSLKSRLSFPDGPGWICFCLLAALFGFALAGCAGWTAGSLVVGGMERIYVPFIQNETFYRGIEEGLTGEVLARINERSDLYLADRESAQLILEGRVTGYKERVLSEDRRNEVLESSALVTVKVRLIRVSDGAVLKEVTLVDRAEFFGGEAENLQTSQQESFRVLSHKIVSVVEKGF